MKMTGIHGFTSADPYMAPRTVYLHKTLIKQSIPLMSTLEAARGLHGAAWGLHGAAWGLDGTAWGLDGVAWGLDGAAWGLDWAAWGAQQSTLIDSYDVTAADCIKLIFSNLTPTRGGCAQHGESAAGCSSTAARQRRVRRIRYNLN